ncbi:WLM-domain-containing protein [Fistulina hepatica ATCC 64428]|nr:WLM-domain-containing protein [Fistulina hepatica ATCC 64428]
MVHLRYNEREANPNPHINFITALPHIDPEAQESAKQLLCALAAQVRPLMKAHGFSINSFEEYEWNRVFAGRNWNAGETVELVLRNSSGMYLSTSWLMSTLCHEIAHIKHMNHGPAFQVLWRQLRQEVRDLQNKGYYGDGYWSTGTRLGDSARVAGQGIGQSDDLPEFMCGGAQREARPTARRRRKPARRPDDVTPSLHTGCQTAKKRKPGSRVTAKGAFVGEGVTLAGASGLNVETGFGKRTQSKKARELRALAFERRLEGMQAKSESSADTAELADSNRSDDEIEIIEETDDMRRARLAATDSESGERVDSWDAYEDDFVFNGNAVAVDPSIRPSGLPPPLPDGTGSAKGILKAEVDFRKKEALGMAPIKDEASRKLGAGARMPSPSQAAEWSCLVCTLINQAGHRACDACGTSRGEERWIPR